jgi:hypothetical protein
MFSMAGRAVEALNPSVGTVGDRPASVSRMRRTADRLGFLVFGWLLPASLVVVFASRPPDSPSREECVALWNSRRNATLRAQVAVYGYSVAEIEGAFAEGRYQGCFASFVEATGSHGALYRR